MTPAWNLRFGLPEFVGADAVCLGQQVALLFRAVANAAPNLTWYASDVLAPGSSFWQRFERSDPAYVGSSEKITHEAEVVLQFQSGVFVGVPVQVTQPRFRDGGCWTEDPEDADLGDSLIEIRAFDTSYILVISSLPNVHTRLDVEFVR